MAFGLSLNPKNTRIHTVLEVVLPVANYLISIHTIPFPYTLWNREQIAQAVPVLEAAEAKAQAHLALDPNDRASRWRHMMIRECSRAVRLCSSAANEDKDTIDLYALATDANPKAELRFFFSALSALQGGGSARHTTIDDPDQRCISLTLMREDGRFKQRIAAFKKRTIKQAPACEMGLAPILENHVFRLRAYQSYQYVQLFPLLPLGRREVIIPNDTTSEAYAFGSLARWLDPEPNEVDALLGIH